MTPCVVGQFTQTDPAPLGAGHPFESAYAYGLNNPLVYTDPSGLRGQYVGCNWNNRGPIANADPVRQTFALMRTQIWPIPLPPQPLPPRTMPDHSVDRDQTGTGKLPPISAAAGAGKKTCLCSCRWQTAPNSSVPCTTPFVKFEMVVTKSANCTNSCFKECNGRINSGQIILGPECTPKHHQGRDKP